MIYNITTMDHHLTYLTIGQPIELFIYLPDLKPVPLHIVQTLVHSQDITHLLQKHLKEDSLGILHQGLFIGHLFYFIFLCV